MVLLLPAFRALLVPNHHSEGDGPVGRIVDRIGAEVAGPGPNSRGGGSGIGGRWPHASELPPAPLLEVGLPGGG